MSEEKPSRADVLAAWLGLAIFAATVLELLFKPFSITGFQRFSFDVSYRSFSMRLDVILVGVFLTVFCIAPVAAIAIRSLRLRWRDWYTHVALLGSCAFLWAFLVHFGRRQFGAYDLNILIDTGWRQVTRTAPLLAIECAAMPTLCFWWYNNSVMILAAVFFLSCLDYTYYSKEFRDAIRSGYVKDESSPYITVWHRRAVGKTGASLSYLGGLMGTRPDRLRIR